MKTTGDLPERRSLFGSGAEWRRIEQPAGQVCDEPDCDDPAQYATAVWTGRVEFRSTTFVRRCSAHALAGTPVKWAP